MLNIETKLKDIALYFENKVINGDYILQDVKDCTCTIIIDDKYKLELWITNNPIYNFKIYDSFSNAHIISLEKLTFTNQAKRIKAWARLKPRLEVYQNTILKRLKQKQINRLQKELNSLK